MQASQTSTPETRLVVVACGPTEFDLVQQDVVDLLCSDGKRDRRYGIRALEPEDLERETAEILTVTGQGKLIGGPHIALGAGPYDSETLIAQASDSEEKTWMAQF